MSDEDLLPAVIDDQDNTLQTKRGLDVEKVEFVMGREQERDLRFLYRVDQIRLFDPIPEDGKKRYNYIPKPSDPIEIQLLFEIKRQYVKVRDAGDDKTAQVYLKMLCDLAARANDRRDKGLDRIFEWKKHQETRDGGLGGMSQTELEKLAKGIVT